MSRRRHASSKPPSQRQLRVGELLRHELADILTRQDIRDPALDGVLVTVTEVRVSADLKNATAYVSPLGQADAGEVVEGLTRCRAFLRGQVAKRIRQLKFMPDISFAADASFNEADRIEKLLRSPKVAGDLSDGIDSAVSHTNTSDIPGGTNGS